MQTFPDGHIVYYYAEAQTLHTTYANGQEIFHFAKRQLERHHGDGRKEIVFTNRSIKLVLPSGEVNALMLIF